MNDRDIEIVQAISANIPNLGGVDSFDEVYPDIASLWMKKVDDKWHHRAAEYWAQQEASLEGVLGGFPELNEKDMISTRKIEEKLDELGVGKSRALELGAGICRITELVLGPRNDKTDIVEIDGRLLEKGVQLLKEKGLEDKIGETFISSLQFFAMNLSPEPYYDLVWIQWVLGYLTDAQCVDLFKALKKALKPNGVIVVKENICRPKRAFVYDDEDSSIVRNRDYYLQLFKLADLEIISSVVPGDEWPEDMYPLEGFILH